MGMGEMNNPQRELNQGELNHCTAGEQLVHSYVDADLPSSEQPVLFAHLAECRACRSLLDSILLFRRQLVNERIVVPPDVDAEFMQLLEKKRQEVNLESERHERRPVWRRNVYLSRGSAALLAVVLVVIGFTIPRVPEMSDVSPVIIGHQEIVSLIESGSHSQPVYVFYPGVTVEGDRE